MKRIIYITLAVTVSAILLIWGAWGEPLGGREPLGRKLRKRVKQLETRVAALEQALASVLAMAPYVSVDTGTINGLVGPHVILEGVNFHVRNDSGSTDGTPDGLGNLIIGYNEPQTGPVTQERDGFHNVVIGANHRFSSYGGLVAGWDNTISGPYSSVSGGRDNTAGGWGSSISGGSYNTASGDWSTVSGGVNNTASGLNSSVSGGANNTASGGYSSVSGGATNEASGNYSSVSGGYNNEASGGYSSVSGGGSDTASGDWSTVSGGHPRSVSGTYDWRGGGYFQEQ